MKEEHISIRTNLKFIILYLVEQDAELHTATEDLTASKIDSCFIFFQDSLLEHYSLHHVSYGHASYTYTCMVHRTHGLVPR